MSLLVVIAAVASPLAAHKAPYEAIKAKDGSTYADQFQDAIEVNIPLELREKLAPVVAAIRYAENGRAGREYGILHPRVKPTYRSQAGWCAATVARHWDRWIAKGGSPKDMKAFIVDLGGRYCPLDDPRDKDGLNRHWIPNVTKFYSRFSIKQ